LNFNILLDAFAGSVTLSLYLPFEILLFQKNFFPLDVFLQTLSLKLFSDAHFFLRHCTPEDFFKMLHISSHAISNVFCHWSALTFLREMAIRGCKNAKNHCNFGT